MSLILSGTDGLSDVDGTAATPAIRGTDTNTGIFFPAADTIAFAEGGAEVARFDSSGNLGIGTSSPAVRLDVNRGSEGEYLRAGGDDTGNNGRALRFTSSTGGGFIGAMHTLNAPSSGGTIAFATNSTERMRIDSSGNLLVGTTSVVSVAGVTVSRFETVNSLNNGSWSAGVISSGASNNRGLAVGYSVATPNDSFSEAIFFADASATRFVVASNGGIKNFSANNVNLSDERTKKDIQLAGNYLDKICSIPVKTFLYKDQTDTDLNLGVIAQDVEAVAPELVNNDGFGETPEDGVPLKTIYQTDLQYALMKCIQEQQAIITDLTSRLEALEAK